MKSELRNAIINWMRTENIGQKKVFRLTSIIENEYRLKFEQTRIVTYSGRTETVSVFKNFQTQAQNNEELNSATDLSEFQRITLMLENEFNNKFQETVDDMIIDEFEEPFE